MPDDMASVMQKQGYPENKICFYQDRNFFKWRYSSCTQKYVFYFHKKGSNVTGYVVVKILENNHRGLIVDYEQASEDAVKKILKYIIKEKYFIDLSIYSYGLEQKLYKTFSDLGFILRTKRMKLISGRQPTEIPLYPVLVRPAKETVSDRDFILHGLNTLDFKNWSLKPVCSDAV